jgi:hypothetical protein
VTVALKTPSHGFNPFAAPFALSDSGAMPSALRFENSLRDADTRSKKPGFQARVSESSESHAVRKTTGRPGESKSQTADGPQITATAETVVRATPVIVQPTLGAPRPVAAETLAASGKERRGMSGDAVQIASTSANADLELRSVPTREESVFDTASETIPSGNTSSGDADSGKHASEALSSSDVLVAQKSGSVMESAELPAGAARPGRAQGGETQTAASTLLNDPILSALRAAVASSSESVAGTPTPLLPSMDHATVDAVVQISLKPVSSASASLSAPSKAESSSAPPQRNGTTPHALIPAVMLDSYKPGQVALASDAGGVRQKKLVTNTKPNTREAGDQNSAPSRNEGTDPSDVDAPQPVDAVVPNDRGDISQPQAHMLAMISVGNEPAGVEVLAYAPTAAPPASAQSMGAAAAKAQNAVQGDEKTSSPMPTVDGALTLNNVKLLQRAGQAEMTIGMHSTEFGSISIRTSTVRDQIAAEVSTDHGELGKALLSHLPEMQGKLSGNRELDLRITTTSSSASSSYQKSPSGDGSSESNRREARMPMRSFTGSLEPPQAPLAWGALESSRTTIANRRLDVRA